MKNKKPKQLKYCNKYMKSKSNISRKYTYITLKKRFSNCHAISSPLINHQKKIANRVKENITGKEAERTNIMLSLAPIYNRL